MHALELSAVQLSAMAQEPKKKPPSPAVRSSAKPPPASNSKTWVANGFFVVYTHIVGAIVLLYYRPSRWTVLLTYVMWAAAGIGITMGYHRLWSHRTYRASWPLRVALVVLGTMGFQGSIKWWSERHRLHHRFTDTEHDPYNAKRGLWFSHIGWIFHRPHYAKLALIDVSDLLKDPIVRLQHRYYVPMALVSGFVVPTLLASCWGDALGGFLFVGHVSKLLTWHTTFCINSLAHWTGSQDYSLEFTARGNLLLALLTNGEGHHNFHHEFPKDYRNGIRWYDYDPTKWLIKLASLAGLAHSLCETPEEDIRKALIITAEQKIAAARHDLHWGPDLDSLPCMTVDEVQEHAKHGRLLLIIDGLVHDVEPYMSEHPGGPKLFRSYAGRDATTAFNGGLNWHTQAARTRARTLLVGRIAE